MIPQGNKITGDMVPRVQNILGVPDRRDTGSMEVNIALVDLLNHVIFCFHIARVRRCG